MGDNAETETRMRDHDNERNDQERGRRPYTPPSITRFPLRPEEAVLGFCKTPDSSGPNIGNCAIPSACSTMGS
jgi:hypothetical protein